MADGFRRWVGRELRFFVDVEVGLRVKWINVCAEYSNCEL